MFWISTAFADTGQPAQPAVTNWADVSLQFIIAWQKTPTSVQISVVVGVVAIFFILANKNIDWLSFLPFRRFFGKSAEKPSAAPPQQQSILKDSIYPHEFTANERIISQVMEEFSRHIASLSNSMDQMNDNLNKAVDTISKSEDRTRGLIDQAICMISDLACELRLSRLSQTPLSDTPPAGTSNTKMLEEPTGD